MTQLAAPRSRMLSAAGVPVPLGQVLQRAAWPQADLSDHGVPRRDADPVVHHEAGPLADAARDGGCRGDRGGRDFSYRVRVLVGHGPLAPVARWAGRTVV